MKKYIPFKYILGMIGLFLVMPIIMIFILLKLIGVYDITIAFSLFFGFLIIIGPLVYVKNLINASVVVDKDTITNNINDGTLNFGWTEELNKIKKVELVNKSEVQKIYKNCHSNKAILIDFGGYNIKYISVNLFTKRQIKKLIQHLESKE